MLTHSFEDLAQTFRLLMEMNWKFQQLLNVDRPEAVGTIETAINANLNAFHNLYDLIAQSLGSPVDWYATPELCVILAIRNARHHNKANRVRSLYNYHSQICNSPTDKRKYLYVKFLAGPKEEGGGFFNVPLSWGDLDLFLSLPRAESRLRSDARELIRNYLNADKFEAMAQKHGVEKSEIFFNYVPLTLNAGITIYPYIIDYIEPGSVEAKTFLDLFRSIDAAVTNQHSYDVLNFSLPR